MQKFILTSVVAVCCATAAQAQAQVSAGDIIPISMVIEGKDKKRETIEVKAIARSLNHNNNSTQHH